jgi:hypothetical protein
LGHGGHLLLEHLSLHRHLLGHHVVWHRHLLDLWHLLGHLLDLWHLLRHLLLLGNHWHHRHGWHLLLGEHLTLHRVCHLGYLRHSTHCVKSLLLHLLHP